MATNPYSDPLAFWSGGFIRLGIVLAIVSILPLGIDYLIFNGAAIVLATMALYTLLPLAIICLLVGVGLWIVGRLRK